MEGLRILHVLSPVKWSGSVFNAKADANWKVCEKTIKWLPDCHHYILAPLSHNIDLNSNNVTFIKYDYPKSVQLNRGMFDYRRIKFDFTRCDIDFVFNHQPELTYNIQQWFDSNRYYGSPSFFGFYHWVDCNKSRGSVTGCPSFYMRQLESMHIQDCNFVHTSKSIEYLYSNFKGLNVSNLVKDTYMMPLSSVLSGDSKPFPLPDKKILLFNHRWSRSSGIKKLLQFTEKLPNEYIVWVTDEKCNIKRDNIYIKSLPYGNYLHLLKNCYASLCFIDGYTTWNLSAQDSSIMGRPILFFKHDLIQKVVGVNNGGAFVTIDEFLQLLSNLPNVDVSSIKKHDSVFRNELYKAMKDKWRDTVGTPKDSSKWIKCIESGITCKKRIATTVNEKVRLSSSAHFIRRNIMHKGIIDDINQPYTTYYKDKTANIRVDLFNQQK